MDLAGYRPTLNEVAALFGKSSRWASDLRARGGFPPDGATLAEFIAAYGSFSGSPGPGGGKSIDAHKARLAAAKADQQEMRNAASRRELLPRVEVTLAVQGSFARVRGKLLALPSKCAPAVAAMKSVVAIQEKLTELVHEALAELAATRIEAGDGNGGGGSGLAGGQPADSGSGQPVVAGVHAAAAADGQPMGGPAPQTKPRGKRRAGAVGHPPG